MTPYILIWALIGTISGGGMNYAIGTHSQEFSSQSTCEAAKAAILKYKGKGIDVVQADCLAE